MSEIVNVYCDESCHLEHDGQRVMVLGGVWCLRDKVKEITKRLREAKYRYRFSQSFEVKWTKVSPSKVDFYLDWIDYFFDDDDLHFRALIVPNKQQLEHDKYKQSHDDWYYKMYFDMLKVIIDPKDIYHIYIDYKDTLGKYKIAKLHNVLTNAKYDFNRSIIQRIQLIRSNEVEILPLADLLIGDTGYINRGENKSEAKKRIVKRIQERSGYQMTETTLLRETKFNLFKWHAS